LLAGLLNRRARVHPDPGRIRAVDRQSLLSDCSRGHDLLHWYPQTSLIDGLKESLRRPVALAFPSAEYAGSVLVKPPAVVAGAAFGSRL
jgi:hypothetical protein